MTTETTTRITKKRFNGKKNCRNRDHRYFDCWTNNKDRDDDIYDIFLEPTFCEEVSEEYLEEFLGYTGASSHITYKK